jgi:WD40 repeat protein
MMASFANGGARDDAPRRRRGPQQQRPQQQRPQQRSVSFNDRSVEPLAPQPGGDNIAGAGAGAGGELDDIDSSGCTVWIGQLPRTCAEDPALLKDALAEHGSVASVTVREKPGTRKSWALATFYDIRAAHAAANATRVAVPNEEGRRVACTVQPSDVSGQLRKDSTGWLATVAAQQSQKASRAVQSQGGVSFGDDFQQKMRAHPQYDGAQRTDVATSRTAPFATHTRPGDGPVRDELWGRTEPDDWLHDKKQNHKPLKGFQSNLDQGENTGHEWDVRPDVGDRNAPNRAAVLEAEVFENRWGVKAGAQTMLSHHGKFGKKVQLSNASAFQTSDDVAKSPWATLADAKPQIKSGTGEDYYGEPDELAQRRIQLGPSQTWSKEAMDSGKSSRQEGRKMRDPRKVMPADALTYPYARGGHVKASDVVIEPPNFGAPVAGSAVDEAITADVTGQPQYTHKPAIGPQRGHLDYSMEPRPSTDPRQGRASAHHTVDPGFAKAGFHEGRYHVEPHADQGFSRRGTARHDLPRDARVAKPLRKATKFDTRDVRGGNYITVEHPMRYGKKPHVSHSPWLLSSDDVVKKTRRFADPRAWGAWHNERDEEEIDLGFFWGLGAEGRRDRSLPYGDQYNVARPGFAYHGPRVKPSVHTATGGNTTELLHTHQAETVNRSIALAVWEKDDAERMQHMRDLGRRGQTNTTRKQRDIGKERRKELQTWRTKRLPEDPPIGIDAEEISELPAKGRFDTMEKRWAQPALQVRTNQQQQNSQARGVRFKPLQGVVFPPSKQPPPMEHGPTDQQFGLSHVHGAGGSNARGSMVSLKDGRVAYFVGAVAVVHRPGDPEQQQHFFRGHDAEITCIASHPEGKLVATGQGQGQSGPTVCVWDSESGKELCHLPPFHEGKIICVSFSADGQHLFTVGDDQFHTVAVWAWKGLHAGQQQQSMQNPGWSLKPHENPHKESPRLIASARGPQSTVLACCAAGQVVEQGGDRFASFVSCGVKHCKVWTLSMFAGGQNELVAVDVSMGDRSITNQKGLTSALTCSCLTRLGDGSVVIGTTMGDILQLARAAAPDDPQDLRWKLISKMPHAHQGMGVTALATHMADGERFCSAGKDGRVVLWEPDPDLAEQNSSSRSGSRATKSRASRASDAYSGSRASKSSGGKRSVFSNASAQAPTFTKIDGYVVQQEIEQLSEYLDSGAHPAPGAVGPGGLRLNEEGEPEPQYARAVALSSQQPEAEGGGGGGQVTANIVSNTNTVVGVGMMNLDPVHHSFGHAGNINAIAAHPSMPAYVTVSDDYTVAVWAMAPEHRMLAVTQLTQRATAVAIRPDGSVIAVGLADGSVLLLNMGDSPQGPTLEQSGIDGLSSRLAPIDDGSSGSSSGGSSSDEKGGGGRHSSRGRPHVDKGRPNLSKGRQHAQLSSGYVSELSFSPDGDFLAVGDGRGAVVVHSVRSGFTKRVLLGGQLQASSSSGGGKRGGSSAVATSGRRGRVSALDFSMDGQRLRVETVSKQNDAQGQAVHQLGYWDVIEQRRMDDDGQGGALELRDEPWATNHATVSYNAMGVWHGESAPGVSSLDVAIDAQQQQQQQGGGGGGSSRNVAAVGSGADVKLYRYPSIEKRPTARSLVGHGGTVRGVRFADKGNILLSIGADQAVMVWQRRRR